MRTGRRHPSPAWLALLAVVPAIPAEAASSLDGSNCVLFDGHSDRDLAQCVTWDGAGHTLSVVLTGRAPNHVRQISISRDGKPPFQTIRLKLRPLISFADVGLRFDDMNFDGHKDIALMRNGGSGFNSQFTYLLYKPDIKRFTRSHTLEHFNPVRFDAINKRVVVNWREQHRRASDSYEWNQGLLRLRERKLRDTAADTCTFLTYSWSGRRRMLVKSTACTNR